MFSRLAKEIILFAFLVALFYFNLLSWQSGVLGAVLLMAYLYATGEGARRLLVKFFHMSATGARVRVLGMFMSLATLGFISGVFLIFWNLSLLPMVLALAINGVGYLVLRVFVDNARRAPAADLENDDWQVMEEVPNTGAGTFLYLILAGVGLYFLAASATGDAINTPWRVIRPEFLSVYVLAAILLGLLSLSRLKAKTILFLLCVHAFLTLAYLPLTHELFYGADGWRHIAMENTIEEGRASASVRLSAPTVSFVNKLNLGELAYAQFWSLAVEVNQITGVTLVAINKWAQPLLWAILFPILLFEIGRSLGWGKKASLFLVWLGFLPFALQGAGAFTLPVNLGMLWWMFLLLLILRRVASPHPVQAWTLAILCALSLFGYTLYVILFAFAWVVAEIARVAGDKYGKAVLPVVAGLGAFVLPALELTVRFSRLPDKFAFLAGVKQFIGNLTAYYLATGPRPHDIVTGNILFNQIPSYAFVENFLTGSLVWLVPVAVIFFLGAKWGAGVALRGEELEQKIWAVLAISLTVGYFISRYLLAGEQVLARRLEPTLALLLLVLFFAALVWVRERLEENDGAKRFLPVGMGLFVIGYASAMGASYSLGPDTRAVSAGEYRASQYVWEYVKDKDNFCVIGDTYALLPLEAVSGKKIVGGGFPINEFFAQPEREDILARMNAEPAAAVASEARRQTGAERCYWMADVKKIKYNAYAEASFKNGKAFDGIWAAPVQ